MVSSDELTALMKPGAMRQLIEVANGPSSATGSNRGGHKDQIIFREVCHYCISKTPILGTLTLTRESLTFEPDSRDVTVDERGCGYYQVHMDLVNIAECAMIGVSTDDVSFYDRESMHCNGMLQILLKSTHADAHRQQDPTEIGVKDTKQRSQSADAEPVPQESMTTGFVSQGLSKLNYVVNMAGLYLPTMSQREPVVHRTDESTPKRTFVLFAFFTKEVAHRCTIALMDAMDGAKEREAVSPNHNGISSVPFSSNSLLDMLTEYHGSEQSGQTTRSRARSLDYCNLSKQQTSQMNVQQVVESDHLLRERVEAKSGILNAEMVGQLIDNLPPALAIRDWELSFETSHDGISFCTLYKNLEGHEHCLLLLKDDRGGVFGAFTGHIAMSYKFYGTAETFVFKFVDGRLRVYRAKGNNRCFVYTNERTIVFGGGTNSAITIDDALRSGTSGTSETFCNEPLSDSFVFNIDRLEVWTFGNYLA